MNEELFKQLKNARFPFKMDRPPDADPSKIVFKEYIDLEMLIVACKGVIIKLWILEDGWAGVQLEGQSLNDVIYYKTSQEAVARLWLQLNAK